MIARLRHFFFEYGMVLVLLLLCVFFSIVTMSEQAPASRDAGQQLGKEIVARFGKDARVLIAVRDQPDDATFVHSLQGQLVASGAYVVEVVKGEPKDARIALLRQAKVGSTIDAIAATKATAGWLVFNEIPTEFPGVGKPVVMTAKGYRWPNFLKADNLLNIANQIAVIAIIAVGMTMVIVAAGIDLSVGSLIALSAVLAALLIRDYAGGVAAGSLGMTLCCLAAIAACGLLGMFSGAMITGFGVPPFIATLGMMLVGNGLAFILARGQSIGSLPESFVWLGRGADFFRLPNAVLLMALLYIAGHILMSRMKIGRYLYAVGGNCEAARLSGVPVARVLLFAYTVSGLLAGLGGVIMASQLKSGSPTYGQMYELYVIAAVVVGGTSLSGGEGKMFGTLIGAFIIAVIQNGMNLTNVESYTQKVVLGLVILAAVLLDRLKHRSWRRKSRVEA
jgi:ribose transport system permease protein